MDRHWRQDCERASMVRPLIPRDEIGAEDYSERLTCRKAWLRLRQCLSSVEAGIAG